MVSVLRVLCEKRFSEYNPECAEHWCKEGYYRGWLDYKNEEQFDSSRPFECPKMYERDWAEGYSQGWRESKDDSEMGF